MAIKVSFLTGADTATVGGLFQWDYGQILEIECSELGSEIVEVHFACANMSEAIVRTCAFTNGLGTVMIPDECLEQTSTVTAWVYKVDGTQGHTIKVITLPIAARTRPSNTRSVPADYNDKYGQLIEEVNEAIDAIEKGNVTAANALSAKSSDHATTATSATTATHATSAGSAGTVNKYLHNLKINISGNAGEGILTFQIITSRQDKITNNNIEQQISVVGFDSIYRLPCSGYLKVAGSGKIYSIIAVGFSNDSFHLTGYADSGESYDASLKLNSCNVAYDVIVTI